MILSGDVCGCPPGGSIRSVTRLPLLASLTLVLAATGCSFGSDDEDDLPPAQTGEVLEAVLSDQIEGHHNFVVLPGIRYDFTVSSPREEIDTLSADEAGVSTKAGDGRRFVEIVWDSSAAPGDTFVMEPKGDVEPVLTLTADDESYKVGVLGEEGFYAAIVVVPEDADDIGLEIEYDGLTQVIEDAYDPVTSRPDGNDDLYNNTPTQRWEYCPETRLEQGDPAVHFAGTGCQANISSAVPYYGGLGWAPGGKSFVVVRFIAAAPLAGYDVPPDDYVSYTVDPSEVRLRLEGVPGEPELFPLRDGDQPGIQDDGTWEAVAVFTVPDGQDTSRLSFRRELVGWPEDRAQAEALGAPVPLRRVHSGSL